MWLEAVGEYIEVGALCPLRTISNSVKGTAGYSCNDVKQRHKDKE